MHVSLLGPAMGLVLWSFVMWLWLYATRLPAMRKARVSLDPRQPKGWLADALPPEVMWKADNYNHLMEQPTLFYATTLAATVAGGASSIDLGLAWAYVALRIAHSLWQAVLNVIMVRFVLFTMASLVLMALAARTAWTVL